MLKAIDFVNVYALDFSKAFDSVRRSTVLSKMSLLDIPDNICITGWNLSSVNIHTVQSLSLDMTSLTFATSVPALFKGPVLDRGGKDGF